MPRNKPKPKPVPPLSSSAFEQGWSSKRAPKTPPPPTVSGRWLIIAASIAIAGAAACAWLTLCLLFWQGSWQLLYHPTSAVTRTPASVGIGFEPVAFASTGAGEPRLKGWLIPAAADAHFSRYTVLYLHGQNGNLSDTVDDLAALHNAGMNIFAFDYRGYGESEFAHPSEAHEREDADWALKYLTATRHVSPDTIIVDGRDLGANLALEVAAAHPDLAGVVLEAPLDSPLSAIFNDPRARLVPAHLLVRDRYDADKAGDGLLVRSLWLIAKPASTDIAVQMRHPQGYDRITAEKMLVWLAAKPDPKQQFEDAFARWLDDLPTKAVHP
jgi:pimeloyl-ACP methyl ester carboxylesterase